MPINFLFYLFAVILGVSALCVVLNKNPVYSALWLIFAFFNSAGLFLLLGAEFLSMLLVIVYVGAVAVMFLFVVMTINLNIFTLQKHKSSYYLSVILICVAMMIEMFYMVKLQFYGAQKIELIGSSYPMLVSLNDGVEAQVASTNTHNIGNILYTNFVIPFQISGLVLLVAMIGAIVLTRQSSQTFSRKPFAKTQLHRSKKDCIELVEIKSGDGVPGI